MCIAALSRNDFVRNFPLYLTDGVDEMTHPPRSIQPLKQGMRRLLSLKYHELKSDESLHAFSPYMWCALS